MNTIDNFRTQQGLTSHFDGLDVFLQCSYGDTIVGMLEYRISSSETII